LRKEAQKPFGADFQFQIKQYKFQVGGFISGNQFLGANNSSIHTGYGWRKENSKYNFSIYTGFNYMYGVYAVADTDSTTKPQYYFDVGAYVCAQAIKKFTYDIGGGLEVYLEASKTQIMGGVKFILFFSDSYRGLKRNYNPNVRKQ